MKDHLLDMNSAVVQMLILEQASLFRRMKV